MTVSVTALSQLTHRVLPAPKSRVDAMCRDVIQNLSYAVVLLDDQMRIVLANQTATLLFEAPVEQLLGASITGVIRHHNLAAWLRAYDERPTKVIEIPLPRRGRGKPIPTVKMTATLLTTRYTLLVAEDITEKARLEQQLVETEKQAAMGQLAAGILHEVSNPLASLAVNLAFVRSALSSSDAAVTQALDVSREQLDQMRQLLGTLSGFTGRPTPHYEVADLHDIVRRCVTFIAKEAERRHIELLVSFAPSDIDCKIDVRLIKQVLLNLLKNAMDAMPNGGRLEVKTIHRRGGRDDASTVDIVVADTGVGIAQADLRRVFRPLFSTKPHGVGLGLSFCRQAVEEHGGEIRITSPGKDRGAVAIVSLPLGPASTSLD
jgi:two-component system, sporulation sensor kinase E